jgi:hypothetical protein
MSLLKGYLSYIPFGHAKSIQHLEMLIAEALNLSEQSPTQRRTIVSAHGIPHQKEEP